jgi:hypothetical protein
MSRQRPQRLRHDQQFWQIVKDLRWKLEDGTTGTAPPPEPEFGYGQRRRGLPRWATHAAAFMLGAMVFAMLLWAPAVVPIVGAGAAVTTGLSYRRLRS